MAGWNVLATSLEGQRDTLLGLLRRFGRFRGAGYRNVVVGQVDDVPALLDRVRDALAADPFLPSALAKLVPIEKTVRIDPRNAAATLAEADFLAGHELALLVQHPHAAADDSAGAGDVQG